MIQDKLWISSRERSNTCVARDRERCNSCEVANITKHRNTNRPDSRKIQLFIHPHVIPNCMTFFLIR